MTTTDDKPVRRQGHTPTDDPPPSVSALRRSGSLRLAIAALAAGAITVAAITGPWGQLNTKADVIGYPIFANFNPYNYSRAYWLVVGVFPIATLLIFEAVTWIGARVGLATPAPRGSLRLGARLTEPSAPRDIDSPRSSRRTVAVARPAFVGAVLGLEVGIATNHLWVNVVLVGLGYLLTVGLGSVELRTVMPPGWTWTNRLAAANSAATPLTVSGLVLVSAHTQVRIVSSNVVHHYPWFPAWLGLPLTAALLVAVLVSLRRAGPAAAASIERRGVVMLAAPVALFALIAHLPGDLGAPNLFEEGQSVTETMLLGHGWLPWRDVVLTHGLLGDVAPASLGWGVFGNSYWGAIAGVSVIFYPLAVVATYWLVASLVGRNWPMLAIAALIFLGTWLGSTDTRFLLWPLILLLLTALLARGTPTRAIALGLAVVAQAVVTPEMAPAALIVAAVLAAYEWYWRAPGTSRRQAFNRTVWLAIAVVTSSAAFLIYMASRGALGDVVYVTVNLVVGHTLDGALPPSGAPAGVSDARFDVIALAPVAALLISFAYAAVRLRLRRPFLLADWPMAAAAIFLLLYYTKFLARMDLPHAYQPFIVATPLMIYIVYRAVNVMEQWVRNRLPRQHTGWLTTACPVGAVVLVVFLVSFWGSLHAAVQAAPADYRPTVATAPSFARFGYSSGVDGAAVEDLQRIVNAYLRQGGRLMDITDEPALFYYYLGHGPSSRWYAPNGIVDTAELQRDLLSELRRDPPKLIIFDDTDTKMYGLSSMDGVSVSVRLYAISKWILDHYQPLAESHGRTIYAIPGVPPVASLHLHLHEQPATAGVRFLGQECSWGYAPTFLGGPTQPSAEARALPVSATPTHGPQVIFTGWAGDLRARRPARVVVATFNGRIISRATPDIARTDVPAAGYPAGFLGSGFRLSIPTWANASNELKVFAIGRDGSVAQLAVFNQAAQGGTARIGRRQLALQPRADIGHVDGETAAPGLISLKPPAGSTWRDYRWLEVDAPSGSGFVQGGFDLSDRPDTTDEGRVISFATLERSPRRYIIPVSSCQQWDGFGSRRLFLSTPPGQRLPAVALVR